MQLFLQNQVEVVHELVKVPAIPNPALEISSRQMELEGADIHARAEEFYRTYVASGPRSSIAHCIVAHRKVQRGDMVVIDVHPTVNAYHADLCRTICVGESSERQQKAFNVYLRAQQSAIEAVSPSTTMTRLENLMHEIFEKEGYEEYYIGPPIHGVG